MRNESIERALESECSFRREAVSLEVRAEFRKVTWPPQKEAMAGTIGEWWSIMARSYATVLGMDFGAESFDPTHGP